MSTEPSPFALLKEQERQTRQRLIVEAAERVFAQKPFEQVSMREIASEAGISPSSIYRYFPDQQSLFAEAFAIGTQEIISRVDARIAGGQIGSLRDLARLYVDFLLENDHYFRMMTHFMLDGRLEGQPLERLNQAARAILELFERLLSGTGADAHLSAHAFFAALNGILISFRQYPGRSPEAVRRHMQTLADLLARRFEESTGPQ
ncbi:MAG: TetR/AcrR family transcriptional regulator [Desulfobacterales bacterium]|jgi:AcrR family transcriptional regulator|nr:TetR/AcrR family transcriptional regulator [Desulfobacteraceae bacterium]MDD3991378.1 TetR/AcrR family transcriptional regulator [Desulfobacteraceae bacterium]MDY0311253.1 TetR/AcrR family transcriptional regulator [Desulfobacterales bacterium]